MSIISSAPPLIYSQKKYRHMYCMETMVLSAYFIYVWACIHKILLGTFLLFDQVEEDIGYIFFKAANSLPL